MNKKGFTMVELLAVIVVLSLIIGIATTSAITISNRSKKKMYNSKIEMILSGALIYAQDHPDEIIETGGVVSVDTLNINGYLKKDENDKIINPLDNQDMGSFIINISKKNNRYIAKIICNNNTWNKNNALNDDIKEKYCSN